MSIYTAESVDVKYVSEKEIPDGFFIEMTASESVVIEKNTTKLIPTGIYVQIPSSYELLVFSHNNLLAEDGFVLNSPGTVDSDYRGEIKVIATTITKDFIQIEKGVKVAIATVAPIETVVFREIMENFVDLINHSNNQVPGYQSSGASGMDLFANLKSPLIIDPMQCKDVSVGISVQIPNEYHMQIRSRSGLAAKHSISIMGSPIVFEGSGSFTGEISIPVMNLGKESFTVQNGMRIAQAVFVKSYRTRMIHSTSLCSSERGAGGFGSTGC